MYYLIYKTTNIENGRFYIGKHKTEDLNDGYLGSGLLILQAMEKYRKDSFIREILEYCKDEEEMNRREKEIITLDFLKENKNITYNLSVGGQGGELLVKNSEEWKIWYSNNQKSLPQKQPKDSQEYKEWKKQQEEKSHHNKSKDSSEYKEWYKKQQASAPYNMPKNSQEYIEWDKKREESMPYNKPKDSLEYQNWFSKNQASLPCNMPKDSLEFAEWNKKRKETSPQSRDKNSPEYIEWKIKHDVAQKKMCGKIRIHNITLQKSKFIMPEECELYFTLGWKRGILPKNINLDNK